MKWVNFGGGHHITRPDYDIEALVRAVDGSKRSTASRFIWSRRSRSAERGVARHSVLDIVENDSRIAILDASAACHMPDVLEAPYRPAGDRLGISRKTPL
jgi:carboxynorspermidine decarboxylase